jgi:hypothetical protein
MEIDIFTYCDFAKSYGNKLCITGAHDTIWAKEFPAKISLGFVAVKFRVNRSEEGNYLMKIQIIDLDGKTVFKSQVVKWLIKFSNEYQGQPNISILIFPVQNLQIPKVGEYSLEFLVDGKQIAAVPLFANFPLPNPKP